MHHSPGVLSNGTRADQCRRACEATSALAGQGRFTYTQINTVNAVWAQEHIRNFGAVMTRMEVHDDLRPFFKNPANAKAVYRVSPGATLEMSHAVLLIGYNIKEGYWLARSSWGTSFADGGDFRVAFGEAEVGGYDTYGVIWKPSGGSAAARRAALPVATSQRAGCVTYKTVSGDYVSKVARRAGVPIKRLLEDNVDVIEETGEPLAAGTVLQLCGTSLQPQGGS
ncbi:MAG: hypothetical protein J3K34DRAFT_202043 [Monoraphidium minutum]|nr:MAG: hypothetical protein J3K34DRAFT_202043 [Monoraphidium minutum]